VKKEVIIQTFDTDASEMKYSGRVILSEDGAITFRDLSEKFIADLNDFGVVGLGKDGQLFPSDGEKFLDALRMECNRSTFVHASSVRAVRARRGS
jgi:hypothetical protein